MTCEVLTPLRMHIITLRVFTVLQETVLEHTRSHRLAFENTKNSNQKLCQKFRVLEFHEVPEWPIIHAPHSSMWNLRVRNALQSRSPFTRLLSPAV